MGGGHDPKLKPISNGSRSTVTMIIGYRSRWQQSPNFPDPEHTSVRVRTLLISLHTIIKHRHLNPLPHGLAGLCTLAATMHHKLKKRKGKVEGGEDGGEAGK